MSVELSCLRCGGPSQEARAQESLRALLLQPISLVAATLLLGKAKEALSTCLHERPTWSKEGELTNGPKPLQGVSAAPACHKLEPLEVGAPLMGRPIHGIAAAPPEGSQLLGLVLEFDPIACTPAAQQVEPASLLCDQPPPRHHRSLARGHEPVSAAPLLLRLSRSIVS